MGLADWVIFVVGSAISIGIGIFYVHRRLMRHDARARRRPRHVDLNKEP